MPIEQHGAGWRVRIRWRGLLVLSVSVPTEADATETEEALRQLRAASRKDLLSAIQGNTTVLRDIVEALRTTKAKAVSLDAIVNKPAPVTTIGAVADRWLDWCRKGGESGKRRAYSDGTLTGYKRATDAFIEHLAAKRDTPLAAITPGTLNGWRLALVKSKTPATANRYITSVQALFTWAADPARGAIPGATPLRLAQLHEERETSRARTQADIEQVLAAVRPASWKAPLLLLADTGMRDAEMRFLLRGDIDLAGKVLRLRSNKHRRLKTPSSQRDIPLTKRLLDALRPVLAKKGEPEDLLFPGLAESRWGLVQAWRRASAKAKVPMRIHDLRHSYTVRLLQGGADIATVRDILGHASIATTDRYARELETAARVERARAAAQKNGPDLPQRKRAK